MRPDLLQKALRHLAWLVAAPTENPPRRIHESGVIARLVQELGPRFTCKVDDLGDGSVTLFATRGEPRTLWNFHIDTVPAAAVWEGSPFELRVEGDRAAGLGACDTKGAAAAMLAAVETHDGDVALLFTSDEEAGTGRCVAEFITRRLPFDAVVVAEPTSGQAVLAHRGIGTSTGRFSGRAGHASQANAIDASATHEAVRWAAAALDLARKSDTIASDGLSGVRFNLGRIDGGQKPNVVAAEAVVRFGVRPPPGNDPHDVVGSFERLAERADRVIWEPGFFGPAFPAQPGTPATARSEGLARELGVRVASPVDFWTEAALFSRGGYPSMVLGPGNIREAHSKNEWVPLDELAAVADVYARALGQGR